MRVLISLLMIAALLLSAPATMARAGASISVTDTTYQGHAYITAEAPDRYAGGLWARADCIKASDGSLGLVQYRQITGGDSPSFFIGDTPSYSGGAMTCFVQLLYLNGYSRDRLLAETTFQVSA